jgi:DNA-binding HxlR family transcriptional regulator
MENSILMEQCTPVFKAVDDALYAIGGKWRLRIITALIDGNKRFNELQRMVKGISSKVLSHELKELELNGFIKKTEMDMAEYEATPYGLTLYEVVMSLARWGKMHRNSIMQTEK